MTKFASRIIIALFSLIILAVGADAETMYVNDKMKITFRAGPGNDRKITSLLSIGQEVKVIQPSGEWVQVQLLDGKEGWVLGRYLTSEVPCNIEMTALKQAHQQLLENTSALKTENKTLKADLSRLNSERQKNTDELLTIQTSFDTLKKESSHFIELKSKYDKAVTELSNLQKRADALEGELSAARKSMQIKWFLGGAGVLIFGMILGISSRREKRRSSLL